MKSTIFPISENWEFTQLGGGQATKENEWLSCKSFPTSIHVELLERNLIPDPFIGLNEWDVQWVGESDWSFRSSFTIKQEILGTENIDLVFDGLDTFCKIELNGNTLGEANNQFITYRLSAKRFLIPGSNTLILSFPSTFIKGRELEKQHGKLNLWNGDSSRLHVRKAQYNYGWDWGPVLMTVGPWRPVWLHSYSTRIDNLRAAINVSEDLSVTSKITLETIGGKDSALHASYKLIAENGEVISSGPIAIDNSRGQVEFKRESGAIELWYPVGYGKQALYTLQVNILDEQGSVIDSKEKRIGFRRVRVVQDELEDQPGHTFLFEINNIRIFCGGSNWIPADSFLTTMTPERYGDWMKLLVNGNQNMVRIWGGGIYEPDCFYNICDELGIMVWHDFMFGCGQYPAYDSFLSSVEIEAEQNVKRLRHHPSIVIFAGNNEDYQIAESLKLDLNYSDETSDFRKTNFPARYIYERLLPEIVTSNSDIYYHRSSPYSGFGQPTTDRTNGDLHQWNVWHGSQEPWHNWDILAGRFVSEFGMEGYPNIKTVDYWLGEDKAERYPQSRTNCNHNKADGFERRLELYLMENFKHAFDIESYVYYTQVMQAETLSSAYRLWRRNWKGRGKEYTAGALVWQLNDCWPVTSWAIVDYFLRPKPAYFAIARELRPFTVGMTRKDRKTFASENRAADFTIDTEVEIWGTNNQLVEKKAILDVTCFDLHSDWTENWSMQVVLAPNASTELWKGNLPGQPTRTKLSEVPRTIIISAKLLDGNTILGRYSNWPEPFKYIHFPPTATVGFDIEIKEDGETLVLSCKKPIKDIILEVEGEDVQWSDQAIDLVPGDKQTVRAIGLAGRAVRARYLGDGTA